MCKEKYPMDVFRIIAESDSDFGASDLEMDIKNKSEMGLLLDLSPEGMDNNEDNADLEAELLAITGDKPSSKQKGSGKTPLPMEHIERMAALCMKDLDDEEEDDDEDLENDEDLMVLVFAEALCYV
ncbi:C2D1B protein, partial [Polypterus senegalus]